jgi:hypothetical protein
MTALLIRELKTAVGGKSLHTADFDEYRVIPITINEHVENPDRQTGSQLCPTPLKKKSSLYRKTNAECHGEVLVLSAMIRAGMEEKLTTIDLTTGLSSPLAYSHQ